MKLIKVSLKTRRFEYRECEGELVGTDRVRMFYTNQGKQMSKEAARETAVSRVCVDADEVHKWVLVKMEEERRKLDDHIDALDSKRQYWENEIELLGSARQRIMAAASTGTLAKVLDFEVDENERPEIIGDNTDAGPILE